MRGDQEDLEVTVRPVEGRVAYDPVVMSVIFRAARYRAPAAEEELVPG